MSNTPTITNFADIVEKNGKTIRDNNLASGHNVPVGALVEICCPDVPEWDECRLYVVKHGRDCDGTPLYALGRKGETNTLMMVSNGWEEGSLRIIRNPDGTVNEDHNSVFGKLTVGDLFVVASSSGPSVGYERMLMRKTKEACEGVENAQAVGLEAYGNFRYDLPVLKVTKGEA